MKYFSTRSTYACTLGDMLLSFVEMSFLSRMFIEYQFCGRAAKKDEVS